MPLPASLSAADVERFEDDGFLIVRNLLSTEEADLLRRVAKFKGKPKAGIWVKDVVPREQATRDLHQWGDGTGGKASIYDAIYTDERVVGTMAQLLGHDLSAFNYKMVTKEKSILEAPRGEGGKGNHWVWHSDFGYW